MALLFLAPVLFQIWCGTRFKSLRSLSILETRKPAFLRYERAGGLFWGVGVFFWGGWVFFRCGGVLGGGGGGLLFFCVCLLGCFFGWWGFFFFLGWSWMRNLLFYPSLFSFLQEFIDRGFVILRQPAACLHSTFNKDLAVKQWASFHVLLVTEPYHTWCLLCLKG